MSTRATVVTAALAVFLAAGSAWARPLGSRSGGSCSPTATCSRSTSSAKAAITRWMGPTICVPRRKRRASPAWRSRSRRQRRLRPDHRHDRRGRRQRQGGDRAWWGGSGGAWFNGNGNSGTSLFSGAPAPADPAPVAPAQARRACLPFDLAGPGGRARGSPNIPVWLKALRPLRVSRCWTGRGAEHSRRRRLHRMGRPALHLVGHD